MSRSRQLAAIMFTDIVGYTAIMQRDEVAALKLLNQFKKVLEDHSSAHQGHIIQYFGDGCVLSFDSSTQCVRCAMAMQKEFKNTLKIPVRIGIHLGEVIFQNNNVFGDGVNLASRVESMSIPGAVLMSKSIRDQIKNKAEFHLASLGSFEFKNVEEPIEVFALANEGFQVPERAQLGGKLKAKSADPKTTPPPEIRDHKEQLSGGLWAEVQRRGVIRVGAFYAMLSLLLIMVIPYAKSMIDLPESTTTGLIILLLIGFPVAIYLAWNYERSPEGFVRTTSEQSWKNPYNLAQKKPLTNNFILAGMALIIVALYVYSHRMTISTDKGPDVEARIQAKSIAVLPFLDFSPSQDQGWFSDGLTEELLNSLAQIPELRVTARTSSFAFKGKGFRVQEIADSLGVGYLVEGSVRKSGNTLRITAQLINPETDDHIWSQTYDREFGDIFTIQENIAENIAATLDIYLDDERREEMFAIGTRNADAYEAYLKGNAYFDKAHSGGDLENLSSSLVIANRHYEQAMHLDPEFAAPHYRHQDLYGHLLIHFPPDMWPDTLTLQDAGNRVREDLNAARANSKRRTETLFYELEYASVSDDWSKVPDLFDELESGNEYLKTLSHFGGGWTKGLILSLDRPDLGLKMHELTLANNPLSPRVGMEIFIFLMAQNRVDSALLWFEKIGKETGNSSPFGLRGLQLQLLNTPGRSQEVLNSIGTFPQSGLIRSDLLRMYAEILVGELDSIDESSLLQFNAPREKYFTTYLYSALGEQAKADSIARFFDSQYMGPFAISDMMVGKAGKIAFDLSATPNFAARLQEAGIEDLKAYQQKHWVELPE
ncbi:MAG: adenylate/guanylate cyclase domain-containing protein [Cyclobacteriaceae bacterium]